MNISAHYEPTDDDEVEDLYALIRDVKVQHPDVEGKLFDSFWSFLRSFSIALSFYLLVMLVHNVIFSCKTRKYCWGVRGMGMKEDLS